MRVIIYYQFANGLIIKLYKVTYNIYRYELY